MSKGFRSWIGRIWTVLLSATLLAPVQLFACNCSCEQSTQLPIDKAIHDCCLKSGNQPMVRPGEHHCLGGQCSGRVNSLEGCCLINGADKQAEALERSKVWLSYQEIMSGAAQVRVSHIIPKLCPLFLESPSERPPTLEFLPLSANSPLRI
jgi:hypothetical protein